MTKSKPPEFSTSNISAWDGELMVVSVEWNSQRKLMLIHARNTLQNEVHFVVSSRENSEPALVTTLP